jgi:hypothetical protein
MQMRTSSYKKYVLFTSQVYKYSNLSKMSQNQLLKLNHEIQNANQRKILYNKKYKCQKLKQNLFLKY